MLGRRAGPARRARGFPPPRRRSAARHSASSRKRFRSTRRVTADRLRRAEDGAADRLAREGGLLEKLEHPVLRHVVCRADLLHDDVLLERQLLRVEQRIAYDVAEHIEAERHVLLQEPQSSRSCGRRSSRHSSRRRPPRPPRRSRARVRRLVPLKAMCSRRCEMPCSLGVSERAPAPTHSPRATLSRCGMRCDATVIPLERRVTSTPISRPTSTHAKPLTRSPARSPRGRSARRCNAPRPRGSSAPIREAPGALRSLPRPHRETSPDARSPS